jgi:hypothetical protein
MANKVVHVCETSVGQAPVPMLEKMKEPPHDIDFSIDRRFSHACVNPTIVNVLLDDRQQHRSCLRRPPSRY